MLEGGEVNMKDYEYEDLRSKAHGLLFEVIHVQNLSQTQKAMVDIVDLITEIIEAMDVEVGDEE
jgi:hypothetical protein